MANHKCMEGIARKSLMLQTDLQPSARFKSGWSASGAPISLSWNACARYYYGSRKITGKHPAASKSTGSSLVIYAAPVLIASVLNPKTLLTKPYISSTEWMLILCMLQLACHCSLCRDGCVGNVAMLWNVLSLFVYFVNQCPSIHPSLHLVDFF